mgnify:CR=1 FL=1
MEQFNEFMDKYFFYIWLVMAVTLVSIFFIRGRKAIQMFSDLDLSNLVYSEKNASGYSTKSFRTKWGGASKVLHIIITGNELIIKTYLFLAHVAEKHDMLHRIPLENILKTEIKKGAILSKLFVEFTGQNGETKEIVLMSKTNRQIKEILDKYV